MNRKYCHWFAPQLVLDLANNVLLDIVEDVCMICGEERSVIERRAEADRERRAGSVCEPQIRQNSELPLAEPRAQASGA